jgi:hypothetical protein
VSPDLGREATRDGQRVAIIHCFEDDGAVVVEAEILPAGATQPVIRGPYRFESVSEAHRLVHEAALALRYLGCTVR